jgi:V/A-type H+/Na+-transporting ATPase subunit I
MITRMAKVRVIGPRPRLGATLGWLQEFGLLHLADAPPSGSGVNGVSLTGRDHRRARQLSRIIADADATLAHLGSCTPPLVAREPTMGELARWATLAADTRARLEKMAAREAELREELALIGKYDEFLEAFEPLLEELSATPGLATHAIIVPASERRHVQQLVSAMELQGAQEWVAARRTLRSGDLAILIVIQAKAAERFDELLTRSRLPELPVPTAFGGRSLAEALPLMKERLRQIPLELEQVAAERRALGDERREEVARASAAAHDLLARLRALERCGVTSHAFAVDGWIPESDAERLVTQLTKSLGPDVGAAVLDTDLWDVGEAPVALHNPRILRPFEAIVRMMPLPRYGSIDPTPFVAVFFPVMFGLIVGDIAYGLLIAAIGLLLHRASRPGSLTRTVSEIMGPCAGFTIIFGILYGELLGDVGRRFFGLHHVVFDREESVVAMLFVAVGLGLVHVAIGLVLGVVSRWHSSRRHAVGSGVMLLMVILLIVAVLATMRVLPEALFTPALVALVLAVPVLIAAEGIIAPIEFLATLGNILSYARVMALGTAGVMLAVVANQMVGAIGSTVVGILFALVFHVVNFAIALFSPTIHVLRLHYVEFFGKFYAPGGRAYQPFRQWRGSLPVS